MADVFILDARTDQGLTRDLSDGWRNGSMTFGLTAAAFRIPPVDERLIYRTLSQQNPERMDS
jgi:hypothetical protein